jgi:hypothetical protein
LPSSQPERSEEDLAIIRRHQKGWYCVPPPNAKCELDAIGPQYVQRFLLASIAGLSLQWGTAGAAVMSVYYTPTVGIGCRSLIWLVYAGVSTLVWAMLVVSSFLANRVRRDSGHVGKTKFRYQWRKKSIELVSKVLRDLGKLLAISNAFAVVCTSLAHFANVFKTCYCNSAVIGLGKRAGYFIFWVPGSLNLLVPWVGGVVMGLSTAVLYFMFLVVLSKGHRQR